MGFIFVIKKIIVLLCLLCMITPCLPAASGYSYTYHVQGQTIILTPCVDSSSYTHYQWHVRALYAEEWFTTQWIPVEDLDTKRMTLDFNETYHVQLIVKNGGSQYQTGEYIKIGSDHTLTSVDETVTDETGIDYLRHIPDPLVHLVGSIPPLVSIIILFVFSGIILWFILWDDRVTVFKRIKK